MEDLTISEKRTIFQILVLIMKADTILDSAEMKYLDHVFHDFGLDISEFDHIEMIDYDYLSNEFYKFSVEKKKYAKKLFVEMSECDGYVDPRETNVINYFIKEEKI